MNMRSIAQRISTVILAVNLFVTGATLHPTVVQAATVAQTETLAPHEPATHMSYGSFFGELSSDYIRDIALDSAGNIYVAGYTYSKNLGGHPNAVKGLSDAFVAKLNPAGSALQWITYLGGNNHEEGYALAVSDSAVWITGYTDSKDFPTTDNAFQRNFGGFYDVLLARLEPTTGAINYSTYIGLDRQDEGRDIAMDQQGNVYLTGLNNSTNVLAVKVTGEANPQVLYSVQWGDDYGQDIGYGIAVDGAGNAYITGMTENAPSGSTFPIKEGALQSVCAPYKYSNGSADCSTDAFLSILNAEGNALIYSSLIGGGGGYDSNGGDLGSGRDEGRGIALDAQGNIYLTGGTYALDFPTVNAAYENYPDATNMGDGWAMKLTPDGKTILYSTYLGGDSDDEGQRVVTDGSGNAYVLGWSRSNDFPTLNALQDNLGKERGICFSGSSVRACYDSTLTKLNSNGGVVWSTYFGKGWDEFGYGLTRSSDDTIFLAGVTNSIEYPTSAGALQAEWGANEDGFITAIKEGAAPVTPTPVAPTPVTPTPVTPTPVTPTPVTPAPVTPTPVTPMPPGNSQTFLPLVQR